MTPTSIVEEIRDAREDFHRLVDGATTAELRKQTSGTKWTNDQLLFHMLFGYMIARTLHRSSEKELARGMHFPVGWDPYFRDYMTVQDVLHYATQHYGTTAGNSP